MSLLSTVWTKLKLQFQALGIFSKSVQDKINQQLEPIMPLAAACVMEVELRIKQQILKAASDPTERLKILTAYFTNVKGISPELQQTLKDLAVLPTGLLLQSLAGMLVKQLCPYPVAETLVKIAVNYAYQAYVEGAKLPAPGPKSFVEMGRV